jgi:ubiquitin carboxyl-terminal hydrolase 8
MSGNMSEELQDFLEQDHILNSKLLNRKGLCGLTNIGNTCFMNSILQCINHTLPLTQYFLSNEWKEDIRNDKIENTLVEQWNYLSRILWFKNSNITPRNFFAVLINLVRSKGLNEFLGYSQNDSQEFLQFFLDSLHNGLSREVVMNINGEVKDELDKHAYKAYDSWKKFFKNDFSKIVEIFYSQFYQEVITYKKITNNDNTVQVVDEDQEINLEDSSKYSKEITYLYEPFNNLSLELPEKDDLSIYDCLDHFTDKELIIKTDEKTIFRQSYLWSLGDILIIFFKRFSFDVETGRARKKNNLVTFPLENLDLSKYVKGYSPEENIYNLYGVVNQSGGLNSGHYYAYIKNTDTNWYKFDDNIVSTLDSENVVTHNAYCLFYQKK